MAATLSLLFPPSFQNAFHMPIMLALGFSPPLLSVSKCIQIGTLTFLALVNSNSMGPPGLSFTPNLPTLGDELVDTA